jgi:hypothetical protein
MPAFTSDEVRSMFIWGAIGGSLPTLGKIAGTYGANFDAPTPRILGVLVAVALYAMIGAVVSRAIGNPDVKQALFAGIAAPAIVVSVLAGASDSNSRVSPPGGRVTGLWSPAYAEPARPPAGATRNVLIYTHVEGKYPVGGTVRVSVAGSDVGTIHVSTNTPLTTVAVPEGPVQLEFSSLTGVHATTDASSGFQVRLTIVPQTSIKQDLFWALGAGRALEIGEMRAEFFTAK